MGELERVLEVVRGLHAASTAPEQWDAVMTSVWRLVGGVASTFELMDRKTFGHDFFQSSALPGHTTDIAAYLERYAAINPRAFDAVKQKAGAVRWDQQFIEEREMDRQPFYAEHLAPADLRYHFYGVLQTAPDKLGALTVQLTRRQSDGGKHEARLLKALLPHASQALDAAMRLRGLTFGGDLAEAVDWLVDGLVILGPGGQVVSASEAARSMAKRNDGLAIVRGQVEFSDGEARRRLHRALKAIAALASGTLVGIDADFTAQRTGGMVPYSVSVRPLSDPRAAGAFAMMLIRDPLAAGPSRVQLQRAFGLTDAEAHLAAALIGGQSPSVYARVTGLSRNTVYTHLLHLKDKCGTQRLAELIRVLNAVATRALSDR